MTAAKALHPLVLQTLAQHLARHRRCQAWQPPVPAVPGGAKEISKSANTPTGTPGVRGLAAQQNFYLRPQMQTRWPLWKAQQRSAPLKMQALRAVALHARSAWPHADKPVWVVDFFYKKQ